MFMNILLSPDKYKFFCCWKKYKRTPVTYCINHIIIARCLSRRHSVAGHLDICICSVTTGLYILFSLSLSQGYLLRCVESVAFPSSDASLLPDWLHWLFSPLGKQFFMSCDWSVKFSSREGVFTSQRDPGAHLMQVT